MKLKRFRKTFFSDTFKRQIHLSEHLSRLEVGPLFSFVVSTCMYDKVQLLHWTFSTKDTLALISVLSGRLRAFIFSEEVESELVVLSNQIFKQNFRFFWDFPLRKNLSSVPHLSSPISFQSNSNKSKTCLSPVQNMTLTPPKI